MMHRQRGTSMAETAVTLVLTLMLLFGFIYAGQLLYTFQVVTNGARLGSRYAIVRGANCTVADCPATNSSIQTYVQAQAPASLLLNPANMTVTTTWSAAPGGACSSTGTNAAGNNVCVTVTYPFSFDLPFIPNPGISISSTSDMVITQ
jgi:Flp pilus assembly protein TadG